MAKPILIANWKHHPDSLALAASLVKDLAKKRNLYKKTSFFIAPPLPYLEAVMRGARTFAQLGAQDIEVPLPILKSFGVRTIILGHSDKRSMGEKDEDVARKIPLALRAGITPIVCVGESELDHDGEHFNYLRRQIKGSLASIKRRGDAAKVALAYEPVWAIGKKAADAITPRDLGETTVFIRKVLTDLFGRDVADKIPLLYGGSVEPNNAEALYAGTGIRGFLVGHASLNPKALAIIAESITG